MIRTSSKRRNQLLSLRRGRPTAIAAALILLLAGLAAGCDDDVASGPTGQSVTGRIIYTGDAAANLSRPAIQVYAFATFPPQGAPHASVTIPEPDLVNGTQYELEFLEAGTYYVLAELSDLDNPDATSLPGGAYPDFCALSNASGNVTITADQGQVGINITLYGGGGAEDPCNAPNDDVCPEDGRATISLLIESSLTAADIGENDTLTYALFGAWPATAGPTRFQILTSGDLEFPLTVVDNNVPPEQQVIYACYDRGGDNQRCDGEGDIIAVHEEGALVDFAEATITTASLTLETSASEIVTVQDAEDAGCDVGPGPAPDGVGEVQVHITSTDLTPSEGDTVSVTLFEAFPPEAGPEASVVLESFTSFPVDLTIADVDAGDHYLAVCHDLGGDSRSCDAEGDTIVWYLDGETPITVRDQETLHVYQSMEGESLAADTIQVVLHSSALTPTDGDSISATAFTAFPPAGPPVAAAGGPVATFPAVLTLDDVPTGDLYIAGCYDSGGDNQSCDGEGDVILFYGGGESAVEMTQGSSYSLDITLDPM